MKPFIIGLAAFILSITCYSFLHDYNLNRHGLADLRMVCEEASVAGSLFYYTIQYSNGKIVFNQVESKKAVEAVIAAMLRLDNGLNPTRGCYWQNQISYKIHFFDDSNTVYPYLFVDPDTGYTHLVRTPTVVVTINAGKARYTLPFLKNGADNIRSAAHAWEGR